MSDHLSTPPQEQGHRRNKASITRATRPRSSTKGPLDVDNGLLTSPTASASQLSPTLISPARSPSNAAHPRQAPPSPTPQMVETRPKDFAFLLQPEIYHPLNSQHIPPAFRNSQKQPSPEVPIDQLLAKGHFRAAAIAAAQELTGSVINGSSIDPHDASRIFRLLYTRLACLTLIDATSLAAQEAKALEDLNDPRRYIDDNTNEHLVPWELRVLHVRLQALGFGDPRRAVMSYHDLAREARENIRKASVVHDNSARELWKSRLHELGIKVAGALIEMDDLSGAAHHLDSLKDRGDGKLALSKALLWLHLGDIQNAQLCASQCSEDTENVEKIILALCDMADSNYEQALQKWQEFDIMTIDEMVGVNQAVCLVYLGRIQEGRTILEKLVDSGLSSHTLLFNLSTTYELCSERNRVLKGRLSEKVANMEESPSGWEKTNADFKL
ncbi:hypothetical protein HDV63DRAFT_384828 [Trichoderma sp. SZMC 28014]